MRINTRFRRIIPVLMALVLMIASINPVKASAVNEVMSVSSGNTEVEPVFSNDFETGISPCYIGGSGGSHSYVQDETNGQAISMNRTGTGDFFLCTDLTNTGTEGSVVYELDMKLLGDNVNSNLVLKHSGGFYWPAFYIGNNVLGSAGTELKSLEKDTWFTLSMLCNYDTKTCSVYVDGELLKNDIAVDDALAAADAVTQLRVYSMNSTVTGTEADFLIDNVKVYESTTPSEEGGSEEDNVVEEIFTNDFEDGIAPSYIAGSGGSHAYVQDETKGQAISMNRTGTGDFFLCTDLTNAGTEGSVVYELDMKLLGDNVNSNLVLKHSGGFYWPAFYIGNNVLSSSGTVLKNLEKDTWFTLSMLCNYDTKTCSVYVDGELLKNDIAAEIHLRQMLQKVLKSLKLILKRTIRLALHLSREEPSRMLPMMRSMET